MSSSETSSSAASVEETAGQYRGQSTLVSALVGAVVTVVTSFVPLSPLLGGAVAAYLRGGDRSESLRVGAISGLIAAVPFAGVLGLVFVGFGLFGIAGASGGMGAGPGLGIATFLLIAVFVLVVAALLSAGLSAAGGYILAVVLEE
jgi:hypothetical protein